MVYSLNPMAGVIEGFRWALLDKEAPDFYVMGISGLFVIALLISGAIYFSRSETTFADII